ncbi:MAG: aminopeptidase P family protein [Clostridia bacterium]|nr:aminopeptidase P family protein [Clostridia bacterium]
MNNKIKWLRDKLNLLNIQGMIITNNKNIKYLTNIDAEGILVLTRKENIYITDGRYIEAVHNTLTIDDNIIVQDVSHISKEDYENYFLFCENIGFEETDITYAKYKEYIYRFKINNFVETEAIIEKQRMIKDEDEIENIKTACKITDECFEYLCKFIKKGMTEKQIAKEIEEYFVINGADGLAFDTVVASGPNSSMPHAVPTDRRIETGDCITIDMGCKYNGYCSDMTRTIFIDNIDDEKRKIYDLVLKNQKQILDEIKEGITPKTLTKMVEGDFKINDQILVHSLGHGVGLEVHELPYMSARNEKPLKGNMVITNEPGIYIPGKFGVRIEDTVLVTKAGCVPLTKSNKNYIVINN